MHVRTIENLDSTKGHPYITRANLRQQLGISLASIDIRVREIKKEVENGRYTDLAVIKDGGIVLINYLVFIDYEKNRQKLLEPNLRKYVEPFNPREVAENMGWYN